MSPKVEGLRTEETSLRYPKELVERYGAKAGLLLYVAQKLPDIPQAPMIVNEPGEDIEDFLRRADKAGIDYPRFFRSSAVAELLGYEGMFGTEVVRAFETGHQEVRHNANYYGLYRDREYYDRGVREIIDQVKHSPQNLKRSGVGFELPNEINVIIAEKSPSLFVGTLIKHPNQDNRYLITITSDSSRNLYGERGEPTDARRTCYSYSPGTDPEVLRGFSAVIFDSPDIREDLQTVCSWHERIASLSDLDPTWTYQLEFGITPPCLFQVRPFKPRQKANFKLGKQEVSDVEPIVIGFTPPEGLILKVVDNDSEISSEDCVFVDRLRYAWPAANFPNLRANLFYLSNGFLQHHDVQAIRKAQTTGLFMSHPLFRDLKPGDFVNLQADGENIKVTKINPKPNP